MVALPVKGASAGNLAKSYHSPAVISRLQALYVGLVMKYLNSSFSIPPPEKLDGITCEACIYGTKRDERHTGCRIARGDWVCADCVRADPAFVDAVPLADFHGDCERCDAEGVILYRIPGTFHGLG